MEKENKKESCCQGVHFKEKHYHHGESNAIYGLGVIGALFYFLQNAVGFSAIVIGIGKAIFWPAVVIFKVLTMLEM